MEGPGRTSGSPLPRNYDNKRRLVMARPKVMCRDCPHPRDQHSVYRPKCLINGCTCTEHGGNPMRVLKMQNGGS